MDTSRRSFLQAGWKMSLSAGMTGLFAARAFGQGKSSAGRESQSGKAPPKDVDTLSQINEAMFAENLNTDFSFSLGRVYLADLTLIMLEDLQADGTSNGECFALVFQGPAGLPLNQGTYSVRHKILGAFQLFIVPGNNLGAEGVHYEAVINRALN